MCQEDEKSSFPQYKDQFKAIFDVEIPDLPNFDAKRRMLGVDGYNLERLKNLCEKEFFEGDLIIEMIGVEQVTRSHYGKPYLLHVFKLLIEGNKKEKFHYCCKLVHELAANVCESYKKLDKMNETRMSHLFSIIK